MAAQDIIIRPIITEKSMNGIAMKKYTFEVAPQAGKIEIRKAVEELFGVKVEKVNITNSHPKKKRVGKYTGMTSKYKKAIVTLKKGETISFD